MSEFRLHAPYQPTGDQPEAIRELVEGFKEGNQVPEKPLPWRM